MKIKKTIAGSVETNCYLVLSDNELAVVDPGDEAEKIITEIEKLGKVDYKYILLTHGHFDHVMAVNELKKNYGFKVVIGEKDKDISGLNAEFGVEVPKTEVDIYLKDKQVLSFGGKEIKIMETPGHTRGSVCYLIDDNLFSGDTLFHHSHGRTDLPGGSGKKMKESLDKLLKLNKDIKVYPGHGEETAIKKEHDFFRVY